jgi:hypothetical protein
MQILQILLFNGANTTIFEGIYIYIILYMQCILSSLNNHVIIIYFLVTKDTIKSRKYHIRK